MSRAASTESPYVIIDAKKTKRRRMGEADLSEWDITFQHTTTGETITVHYLADHQKKTADKVKRNERYDRSGTTSIVKSLTPSGGQSLPDDLPKLALKSLNQSHWKRGARSRTTIDELLPSVPFLQAQGACAYAGTHDYNTDKAFLIMQDLGEGDLYEVHHAKGGNSFDMDSHDGQKNTLRALCRLIAFLDFFHQTKNRPICDIKPENMIPTIIGGQLLKLYTIDLDGSLGKKVMHTPECFPLKYLRAFVAAESAGEPSRIPHTFDFACLAINIADILRGSYRSRHVVTYEYGSTGFPTLHSPGGDSGDRPYDRLIAALHNAKRDQTGRDIITTALNDDMRIVYEEERQNLDRRYLMSIITHPELLWRHALSLLTSPDPSSATNFDALFESKPDLVHQQDTYHNTLLHHAVHHGNYTAINTLLASGASLDARNANRKTPLQLTDARQNTLLHQAVQHNDVATVERLLANKVNLNSRNANGKTPIDLAAEQGGEIWEKFIHLPQLMHALMRQREPNIDLIQRCIADGAECTHVETASGLSPFHLCAARAELTGILPYFIDNHHGQINTADNQGKRPLHYAVATNNIDAITKLITAGADLHVQDSTGLGPLTYATTNTATLACIIEHAREAAISTSDHQQNTLLHLAVKNHNLDATIALLDAGADINAQNQTGQSALHLALQAGHTDLIGPLLQRGANSLLKDNHGRNAIDYANGQEALMTELHANIPNILTTAITEGNKDNVNALLTTGVKVTTEAIHLAASQTPESNESLVILKLCLGYAKKDAINIPDSQGRRALHLAVRAGAENTVTWLARQKETNLYVPDSEGKTALHYALDNTAKVLGSDSMPATGMVKLLVDSGSDPSIADKTGQTAADLAQSKGIALPGSMPRHRRWLSD